MGLQAYIASQQGVEDSVWPCSLFPLPYVELLESDIDGAICQMIILYFLAHGSPPVKQTRYLARYRLSIAYWILNEQLPI